MLKIPSIRKCWITLLCILILIPYFFLGLTAYDKHFVRMNTIYSEGFSPDRFYQIKAGMSKEEVKNMLGEPLNIRVTLLEEYDYGLPRSYRYIFHIPFDDYFVYECYRVTFYTPEWIDQENQRRKLNKQEELKGVVPDTVYSTTKYWFNE